VGLRPGQSFDGPWLLREANFAARARFPFPTSLHPGPSLLSNNCIGTGTCQWIEWIWEGSFRLFSTCSTCTPTPTDVSYVFTHGTCEKIHMLCSCSCPCGRVFVSKARCRGVSLTRSVNGTIRHSTKRPLILRSSPTPVLTGASADRNGYPLD
jgi:hypothetical protein